MENESKLCACSGIRSCILCDQNISRSEVPPYCICWFCIQCSKVFEGDISRSLDCVKGVSMCSFHNGMNICESIKLDGIKVYQEFISTDEEKYLINELDKCNWKMSQSGRRKQDFGPQVNFKRKKVKVGSFSGFPSYCKFLLDRMKKLDSLLQFHAVELCNLEYMAERGSSIDPHIDDTWLWGEQLITINLLSNTILTLNSPKGKSNDGITNKSSCSEVQILMPARSLVIIEDDARYLWMHGIKREHVGEKRIAMTFRNLSNEFEKDEKHQGFVMELLKLSETFQADMS